MFEERHFRLKAALWRVLGCQSSSIILLNIKRKCETISLSLHILWLTTSQGDNCVFYQLLLDPRHVPINTVTIQVADNEGLSWQPSELLTVSCNVLMYFISPESKRFALTCLYLGLSKVVPHRLLTQGLLRSQSL